MQGDDWVRESLPPATRAGVIYMVQRYRPRIEGLFSRIEHWINPVDGRSFWKTISKDNITSLYGVDSDGRLADPAAPSRIFKWLLQQSHDDKGNVVIYGAASVTLNKDVNLANLCVGSSALFVAGAPFTLSTADPGDLKELTMLLHYSVSS